MAEKLWDRYAEYGFPIPSRGMAYTCLKCGAIVLDWETHDRFHQDMETVLYDRSMRYWSNG